ncbi:fimbrial protein [Pantoea sp. USHLN256]|uniref:fimbrial protein n=1 Tax=Pantoea sp. USHLN256 TaxID=3081293 RepID=UPI0030189C77
MTKSVLALSLILGMTSFAQAATGTITFDGTIRDTACSIDAENLDQSVSFGLIAKSLINQGGRSAPENFSIKLKSCSKGTLDEVQTTLRGAAGSVADTFGVTGVNNAGIQIVHNGAVVKPNAAVKQALNNGDNVIDFQARVIGNTGPGNDVTEGTFVSTVTFDIAYL